MEVSFLKLFKNNISCIDYKIIIKSIKIGSKAITLCRSNRPVMSSFPYTFGSQAAKLTSISAVRTVFTGIRPACNLIIYVKNCISACTDNLALGRNFRSLPYGKGRLLVLERLLTVSTLGVHGTVLKTFLVFLLLNSKAKLILCLSWDFCNVRMKFFDFIGI